MSHPFFSIIIPVYNTKKEYLDTCIESLLSQSFGDFEIIMVDDGSKEECASLLDSYAAADARIRVIHKQNQGVSAARNQGVRESLGKWIQFVDADDWLETQACQKLSEYLESEPCDILFFNHIKEYASKTVKSEFGFEHKTSFKMEDANTKEMLYRRVMQPPKTKEGSFTAFYYSWDKVFNRAFLTDNMLEYPVGIPQSEDKVFVLRCLEKAKNLFHVEDGLYHYRILNTSACRRYSETTDADRSRLADMLFDIAERMDRELQTLKGDPEYCGITEACRYFIFGILTNVLLQKFYHPDCPLDRKTKRAEVRKLLHREPFYSALRKCKYSKLSYEAKLKKLLLSLGWASLFCKIFTFYQRITGKTNI